MRLKNDKVASISLIDHVEVKEASPEELLEAEKKAGKEASQQELIKSES